MSDKNAQSSGKASRSHNRLQAVLDAGAKLFATRGYKATTMRDIASEAGMLPGSLYYHFESKQELLLDIYKRAVSDIRERVDIAIQSKSDPWERFEVGVTRHIETILDKNHYAKVMISVVPDEAPEIEQQLIALRDDYEDCFIKLIDELPLSRKTDRKLLRLMLIGAINSTQLWYRPGTYSPTEIGLGFVEFLRYSLD